MRATHVVFAVAVCSSALAQSWHFRTLAGSTSGGGYADGPALEARFSRPSSVAACADAIFIADAANHAIRRLSRDGQVTTWAGALTESGFVDGARGDARFDYPTGIAADVQCNLVVSDSHNNRVRRISAAGVVTTLAGPNGLNAPQDVAIDSDGSVWVTDAGRRILHVTADGTISTFSTLPAATTIFPNAPLGIALDAGGTIFVADDASETIHRVTRDRVRTTIASHVYAADVVIGADGNLYVANYSEPSVQRLDGNTLTKIAGAGFPGTRDGQGASAQFDQPRGIALDVDGSLLVVEELGCALRRVTTAGETTTIAGSAIALSQHADGVGTNARFVGAGDVEVDASGVAYVADATTIRRVSRDGTVTTIAGVPGEPLHRDGDRTDARFEGIGGIALEPSGSLVVIDGGRATIRRVTLDGTVSTIAGSPHAYGYVDDSGTTARFNFLFGIAAAPDGTIYVLDTLNKAVRRISGNTVSTLAKNFAVPMGIDTDGDGNVYMWDENDPAIRRITPAGEVTVLARNNSLNTFFGGLAVAPDGTIYIGGGRYHSIYQLRPGSSVIERFAGSDVALGNQNDSNDGSRFRSPARLDVAPDGRIFICGNRALRVASMSEPPVITSFTAAPRFIAPGESVTLTWTSSGATAARLEPGGAVAASGSMVVHPSATTVYSLIVVNGNEESRAEVTVAIVGPRRRSARH